MIEVNLLPQTDSFQLPVMLGFDLNKIPFKPLIIIWVVTLFTDGSIEDYFADKNKEIEDKARKLRTELRQFKKQAKKNQEINQQINEYIKQEKRLKQKFEIVKEIIETKKNPVNIMMYISKNSPDDLWMTGLELKDDTIKIQGESLSYKSIGQFIENLSNSVYFETNFDFGGSKTITNQDTGVRTEFFDISGKIKRFN